MSVRRVVLGHLGCLARAVLCRADKKNTTQVTRLGQVQLRKSLSAPVRLCDTALWRTVHPTQQRAPQGRLRAPTGLSVSVLPPVRRVVLC
jgi:hypothetical protein